MKIVSFSVIGLGGAQKQRSTHNFLKSHKPDVIFLQETMMGTSKYIDLLPYFLKGWNFCGVSLNG